VLGTHSEHTVLHMDERIYALHLVGHFSRADLEAMHDIITASPDRARPWGLVALSRDVESYDSDLREVMRDPGRLEGREAIETIVVTSHPIEKMVVNTMAVGARIVGAERKLHACDTLDEALLRLRRTLDRAG